MAAKINQWTNIEVQSVMIFLDAKGKNLIETYCDLVAFRSKTYFHVIF